MKIPYTLVLPTENSIHIGVMATYCNSICNCSKSKQRKESLRLTLQKYKFLDELVLKKMICIALQHRLADIKCVETY